MNFHNNYYITYFRIMFIQKILSINNDKTKDLHAHHTRKFEDFTDKVLKKFPPRN